MNNKESRDQTSKADLARACLVTITNNIGSISRFVAKAGRLLQIVPHPLLLLVFPSHLTLSTYHPTFLHNSTYRSPWRSPFIIDYLFSFSRRKNRENSLRWKLFEEKRTEHETSCLRRQLLVGRNAACLVSGTRRVFRGRGLPPRTIKAARVIFSAMTYIPMNDCFSVHAYLWVNTKQFSVIWMMAMFYSFCHIKTIYVHAILSVFQKPSQIFTWELPCWRF